MVRTNISTTRDTATSTSISTSTVCAASAHSAAVARSLLVLFVLIVLISATVLSSTVARSLLVHTSSTSVCVQQLLCVRMATHKQAQATQCGYSTVSRVRLASTSNDPLTWDPLKDPLRDLQQRSQSTLTTCTPTQVTPGLSCSR